MKKLIRFTILITVLAIFAFSKNTHITKVREFTLEKGASLYANGIEKLQSSENENVQKIAEFIE